jgi:hypothetical protein
VKRYIVISNTGKNKNPKYSAVSSLGLFSGSV